IFDIKTDLKNFSIEQIIPINIKESTDLTGIEYGENKVFINKIPRKNSIPTLIQEILREVMM
ncbi:TPA: hypothetical protein U1U72_000552, partial [Streptococcus suis]|nr:hypothetical protein [Streptococcus suis]